MKSLVSLGLFFFISACALSPQVVDVDPTLSDAGIQAKPGFSPFNLRIIDNRSTNVLGQRGGTYKETATISSDDKTPERVRNKLQDAFTNAGYVIDEAAENQLVISIENMTYRAEGVERVSEVEISAEILATAATQAGQFSKKYKASHTKEVLKAPGNSQNAELINNVFGAVVQRVLDDGELLQYLNN